MTSYTSEQIMYQLRSLAHPSNPSSDYVKARMLEAADEIERLHAERGELLAALKAVKEWWVESGIVIPMPVASAIVMALVERERT